MLMAHGILKTKIRCHDSTVDDDINALHTETTLILIVILTIILITEIHETSKGCACCLRGARQAFMG
jgi:hypothetical protein